MAVTYKDNEIQLSASSQKLNVDVVYARPEDVIKLDFDLKDVKVTFVDGDVDLIFSNGSVISLASYATLAFSSNAPKIYDGDGKVVSLESLLQSVQVLKPEDAVLILANRDKFQEVQNDKDVNKIIMATGQSGDLQGGNPIAGVGDISTPTSGMPNSIIDKTGIVAVAQLKNGLGDYLANNYTTNQKGNTDTDNLLPGNTSVSPTPSLTYKFLFGDKGVMGSDKTINGNAANYYAVQFGTGDSEDTNSQLDPINLSGLGGNLDNRIFDAHAVDGQIRRVLNLDYSGGIFPQSITISGIPNTVGPDGNRIFRLEGKNLGTTKVVYDAASGSYILTQLDPSAKIQLWFIFSDSVADQDLNIHYAVVYYDSKTSKQNTMDTYQDVGIKTVNQKSDLSLNGVVINKGASGVLVDANTAGTGDKIFIGGNVQNSYESRAGQSLVFTGGGDDTINLAGTASGGKNVIYGSTGYDIITGSGAKDAQGNGIDWLVYSNDKSYNDFMTSDAIRDSYYNTMKEGVAQQFYLGVNKADVSALWDKLGAVNLPDGFKKNATSNFTYNYSGITVIGDRNGGISITNIVGTKEVDIFNFYFQGVEQKVKVWGGNAGNKLKDQIVLNGEAGDTATIVIGKGDLSSITSGKYAGAGYVFDSQSFGRITGGSEDDIFKISFDGGGKYVSSMYFDGGGGSNTADFSGLVAGSSITFDANPSYNLLTYNKVGGKSTDFFYNFNKIIGSGGDDTFYGHSGSKAYTFDGGGGSGNVLTYAKSPGGVTFNAIDKLVYKIADATVKDYSPYKNMADQFTNIATLKLSNGNDVVVASMDNPIDSGSLRLDLGDGNDTIRYDFDTKITSIQVDADGLVVQRNGDVSNKDIFVKTQGAGQVNFIGTVGTDIFYGGLKYSNVFDGNGGNNTLSYDNITNTKLSIDLLRQTVSKGSKGDQYKNIQNIVGSKSSDTFSVGTFDPTNKNQVAKISGIKIDGNGGDSNTIKFNDVVLTNLSTTDFTLTFDLDQSKVTFYDKSSTPIDLNIDVSQNIQAITGTGGNDKFIGSASTNFNFDGFVYNASLVNPSKDVYGNTLDYSKLTNDLNVNFSTKQVDKGGGNKDLFNNIQAVVGGKGNDTFVVTYFLGDPGKFFDGGEGNNTLSYAGLSRALTFDFAKGQVFLDDSGKLFDTFKNMSTFTGGDGNNIFILSYTPVVFNTKASPQDITINGGNGINTLDFSNWGAALGTSASPFLITDAGTIDNGESGGNKITYNWTKINSFKGSKNADYFAADDTAKTKSFTIDGNKDTTGDNTLDYSKITVADATKTNVVINISNGVVNKNDNTTVVTDNISNLQKLILTDGNDTITFVDSGNDSLKTLKEVDGGKGDNTINYANATTDIEVNITKDGFSLSGTSNLILKNFSIIKASRGNSTFIATVASNGAKVTIIGNPNPASGKTSILDLSQLAGAITYWNLIAADGKAGNEGLLAWGSNTANIVTNDIATVKLGNTDGNTIYGSNYNHTNYVAGTGKNNTLRYDYAEFKDGLTVVIDSNAQTVSFNAYSQGQDTFSGFDNFIGSNQDDIFEIHNTSKLPNGIKYDGAQGNNTLSFAKDTTEKLTIDVSKGNIEIGGKKITIDNIQSLVLSAQDDTVTITENNPFLFSKIDGGAGNNTISITNGGVAIFNEDGVGNILKVDKNTGDLEVNNFQAIETTTVEGNKFYGSFMNDIVFKVIGSANANHNYLIYDKSTVRLDVDFTTGEVNKGGNKKDGFSGINYFTGSSYADVFYLAPKLPAGVGNFSTIYINSTQGGVPAPTGPQDIVSILKAGDNVEFHTALRKFQGGTVTYDWSYVNTVNFTNNQKVYVSFDEDMNYYWRGSSTTTNSTLVFDTTEAKSGPYNSGYAVVDVSQPGAFTAQTFDSSGTVKANINFNGVTDIVGTGNNDIFYGGRQAINYFGGATDGNATLNYSKYQAQNGIVITFDKDNNATIAESNASKDSLGTAEYVTTFVGTTGNDTFVIADNNGGTKQITIDGGGGQYDMVDFSQVAGGSGMTLDTSQTAQTYKYILKNVNAFKLTQYDDKVIGSWDNKGFAVAPATQTNITVDGGGGNNTLDYSAMQGDSGQANTMNIDLNSARISKLGYSGGTQFNTVDTIAIGNSSGGLAQINFNHIILSGNNISNTLIVSGSTVNPTDAQINVDIQNASSGLVQFASFEFVTADVTLTWDSNAFTFQMGGKQVSYTGFNSLVLGKGNDTLKITAPTNFLNNKGTINGGQGDNVLEVAGGGANDAIELNLNAGNIKFTVGGTNYNYAINNFETIKLGYNTNTVYGTDSGDFKIFFTNSSATNKIDYSKLTSSYTNVSITGIDATRGATLSVDKFLIGTTTKVSTDTVDGIKDIVLSSSDDILNVKNNDNGPTINIDGGKGLNTVSFQTSWIGQVPATIVGGQIQVKGYSFSNFTNVILTDNDDTIQLDDKSSITIDGGKGNNTADYSSGTYTAGMSAIEDITQGAGGLNFMRVRVTKQGAAGQFTDNLTRFNQFVFAKDQNNTYTATIIKPVAGDNPKTTNINFNTTNIANTNNLMDYSKLNGVANGIQAAVTFANNVNTAQVFRDNKDTAGSINDVLTGVNTIQGTDKGDKFNVATNVSNFTINAGASNTGELALSFADVATTVNLFVWDLNAKTIAKGDSSSTTTFFTFNGIVKLVAVADSDKKIDNTFLVYNFNLPYNIDATNVKDSSGSNITVDFSNVSLGSTITVDINMTATGLNLKGYATNDTTKYVQGQGITTIVGNARTQNIFNLTLAGGATSTRSYVIQANNPKDEANVSGVTTGNTVTFNVTKDANGSNLVLNTTGYLGLTLQHMSSIRFDSGGGDYKIAFDSNSSGASLNLAAADPSKSTIILDFTGLKATDYLFKLDSNFMSVSSASQSILVDVNALNGIVLDDAANATAIVNDVDDSIAAVYTNFGKIDLGNHIGNYALNIANNNGALGVAVNNLMFTNKGDVKVDLGTQTVARAININMAGITNSLAITAVSTDFAQKSIVTTTGYDASANMEFTLGSGVTTSYNANGAGNSFSVDNARWFHFKDPAASWNIAFSNGFNYFTGGTASDAIGLAIGVNTKSLVIDFTALGNRTVMMQGVKAGGGYADGLFIGFDEIVPDWRTNAGNATIYSLNAGDMFVDTTVKLPTTGISFNITYGWLSAYIDAAKAGKVTKGVTLDGSQSNANSIILDYDPDVGQNLDGYTFNFDIIQSNGQTVYNLSSVNDKQNRPIDNINFKLINVGNVAGIDGVNTTYTLHQAGGVYLTGSKAAVNTINFSSDGGGVDFGGKPIELNIIDSQIAPGTFDFLAQGNIGGYSSAVDRFQSIDFTNIKNYNNTIHLTFTKLPSIADKAGGAINFIMPEGSKGKLASADIPMQFIDVGPAIGDFGGEPLITIDSTGKLDVWATSSGTGASKTGSGKHFTAQNVYQIALPATINTIYQKDATHSYAIDGGSYNPIASVIFYDTSTGAQKITAAVVQKYDGGGGTNTGTDYLSGIRAINVNANLPPYTYSASPYYNSNDSGSHNISKRSVDSSDNVALYFTGDGTVSNAVDKYEFGSGNVFVSIVGFKASDNHAAVVLDNDVSKLNVSGDGKDHYRVFFVDNNAYEGTNGKEQHFDTNGYFAVVDTNTGRTIYFTGKDINKYADAFEQFLNGKGHIEAVNSYDDMKKAVNGNYDTNPYHNDNHNNNGNDTSFTPGENTNHARKSTANDDIVVKSFNANYQEMQKEHNNNLDSTNHSKGIDSKANSDETDNASNNNASKQANHQVHNNLSYGEKDNSQLGVNTNAASNHSKGVDGKINSNETDLASNHNKEVDNNSNNVHDQHSLNVIGGDDNTATLHSNINPGDVLEFSSKGDLDNVANPIFENLMVKNEANDGADNHSAALSSVNALSSIENTSNLEVSTILYDSSTDHNDPAAKVEDSMHKQNSINGNNHR